MRKAGYLFQYFKLLIRSHSVVEVRFLETPLLYIIDPCQKIIQDFLLCPNKDYFCFNSFEKIIQRVESYWVVKFFSIVSMRLFQGHRVRQKACLLFCSRINKTQKIDYNFPIVSFCLSSVTKRSTKLSAENKVIYEIRGG